MNLEHHVVQSCRGHVWYLRLVRLQYTFETFWRRCEFAVFWPQLLMMASRLWVSCKMEIFRFQG